MNTDFRARERGSDIADATADWHLPKDESELIQGVPAAFGMIRFVAWVFMVIGAVGFVMSARTKGSFQTTVVMMTEGMFLIGISQFVLIYLYRLKSAYINVGSGHRRLESKVPEESALVRIDVVRDRCLIGRDEGYMWLSDGTWFFKGLQTSFRINSSDTYSLDDRSQWAGLDPSGNKPVSRFPLKTHVGSLMLRVNMVDPYGDYKKRKHAAQFHKSIYQWLEERPKGSIESLLPPVRLHPEFKARGKSRYEGLVGAVVMVFLSSIAIFGMPKTGPFRDQLWWFAITCGVVLGVVLMGVMRFAGLELRDLTVRKNLMDRERIEKG